MPSAVMDREAEDGLIPISALQHYLFCPRQCALIHVERMWAEDAATAEGRLLHEKADSGRPERRPGVHIARSVALRSVALGITGKADVVEFHGGHPDRLAGAQAGRTDGRGAAPRPGGTCAGATSRASFARRPGWLSGLHLEMSHADAHRL